MGFIQKFKDLEILFATLLLVQKVAQKDAPLPNHQPEYKTSLTVLTKLLITLVKQLASRQEFHNWLDDLLEGDIRLNPLSSPGLTRESRNDNKQ